MAVPTATLTQQEDKSCLQKGTRRCLLTLHILLDDATVQTFRVFPLLNPENAESLPIKFGLHLVTLKVAKQSSQRPAEHFTQLRIT